MCIKNDEYYMKQALSEAQLAFEKDEVPVGAIVIHKNRIIARAYNLIETLNDVTAHAEMLVITAAASVLGGKYLKECILYVTVEPCLMCAGALRWSQIARIVYGANDEKYGYKKSAINVLHPKTEVKSGILADEAVALLKRFFQTKR